MLKIHESRFPAMGTTAHVVVVGPGGGALLEQAKQRIDELELRWSRFLPASEVTQINEADSGAIRVSSDTIRLVEHAVGAWHLTNGAFDPTMSGQLVGAGYDRPFDELSASAAAPAETPGLGCAGILVDRDARTVTIPPYIGFDPGGIGKGLAADTVVGELIKAGAAGVLVNLGGDLAVAGRPPSDEGWVVAVCESTISETSLTTVALTQGGLATSTTSKRRWVNADGETHHILDPTTGLSSQGRPILATVIAGQAWWAEVRATALLASGRATISGDMLCAALLLHRNGALERQGDFESYERCTTC